MTNYPCWDAKASALVSEVEEQEKRDKELCDEALGLQDCPKGPPTEQAEAQLNQLCKHSKKKLEFIDWSKAREVALTHLAQEEPIELSGPEVDGKAVRLRGSEGVTYLVPKGIVKLIVDKCCRVCIRMLDTMVTSTLELYACSDLDLHLGQPLGTLQVDECIQSVRIVYAERDHVGCIYHQNSPGLSISCSGSSSDLQIVGSEGTVQLCSRLSPKGSRELFWTGLVRRGEGEFPIDLPSGAKEVPMTPASSIQPEPEGALSQEERQQLAAQRRQMGNDMFRANDFMHATVHYTEALHLDPAMGAVWANRAQCWLKLGDHEKALVDAQQCTEVDPANPKGWFRTGMSFHAMQRHAEAIPALLEAEKLEPHNKQITDAIKMAQHMARKSAAGA
jgi:hypothetical protein